MGKLGKSASTHFVLGFLALSLSVSMSDLAFGQFLDAKPTPSNTRTSTPGATASEELLTLKFDPPLRVIMKSKLGVVVRGEMLSMTTKAALVVPDRSRFRNPDGVEYLFEKIVSLNIPDANLKWSEDESAEEFMVNLSTAEDVTIANLVEFNAALEEKSPEPSETGAAGDEKIVVMQPAKKNETGESTVTIICGNCNKKVSLTSKSGQECPHCGILWDNSPVKPGDFLPLDGDGRVMVDVDNPDVNSGIAGNGAGVQNIGQPAAINRPPTAQGGQPVVVPPPIQTQAQPVELTLETLPVWMKVSIFFICFGVMYYAFFHVR